MDRIIKPTKIMVFGNAGSGKSTWSRRLSKLTHLPLYHLDMYFFLAHWVERPYQDFLALQNDLVCKDAWIIDGNATKSYEMRFSHADIAIYFNYSRITSLFRVFKRRIFGKNRTDRPENCREQISWKFLAYILRFNNRVAQSLEDLKIRYPHVTFYTVHNDKEAEQLLTILSEKLNK